MRAKISIAFLSITVLLSFGFSSNQAFAGGFEPESCEECEQFRMNCLASPQDPAVCNRLADQCLKDLMCLAVGGVFEGVDSTALLVSGTQMNAS